MAFNGSAHFAPGTLVEVFQRLGMSFGGDTNAYTSFDHTAYKIELPNTQPATIAEGLQVFSDMAGRLLLRPDMITKERPIILSEKRDRDSIDYREFVAGFQFILPDARLPKRLPIGLQPVIEQRPATVSSTCTTPGTVRSAWPSSWSARSIRPPSPGKSPPPLVA